MQYSPENKGDAEPCDSVLNARARAHSFNSTRQASFPKTPELTAKQREILAMLREVPQPSQRDMAARLGVCFQAVQWRMRGLLKKGVIRQVHQRRRGVEIVLPAADWPAELTTDRGVALVACGWKR